MPYFVLPLDVSAHDACVWIGALDERIAPDKISLAIGSRTEPLAGDWESWVSKSAKHRLDYRRFRLTGLEPDHNYHVQLLVDGRKGPDAAFSTLPVELPGLAGKPFCVLLGSCFCERKDAVGGVGRTFLQLPASVRPSLKILCGDQVYLDSPWWQYTYPRDDEALEDMFFENYVRTWFQAGTGSGFHHLLRSGANYFSSDDHEFWNNAPNAAAYVMNTWTKGGRRRWLQLAKRLYSIFQPTGVVNLFSVGRLSFFIADTRVNRDRDRSNFMSPGDFIKLEQWARSLRGPGVLVMGQPLFAERAGFAGNFTDWNLPNYSQYERLARLIASSAHSVVFLTGDVHFGRVALCTSASGIEHIEVISSPMALVDKSAGGDWRRPPDLFPSFDIPGLSKVPVVTEESFVMTENHFSTLEFVEIGSRVQLTVKAWPIREDGGLPSPTATYRRKLN